jgi:hypothetical protein
VPTVADRRRRTARDGERRDEHRDQRDEQRGTDDPFAGSTTFVNQA